MLYSSQVHRTVYDYLFHRLPFMVGKLHKEPYIPSLDLELFYNSTQTQSHFLSPTRNSTFSYNNSLIVCNVQETYWGLHVNLVPSHKKRTGHWDTGTCVKWIVIIVYL